VCLDDLAIPDGTPFFPTFLPRGGPQPAMVGCADDEDEAQRQRKLVVFGSPT
jgi:hypothetical protein